MKLRAIYERFTSDFASELNKNKTKKQKNYGTERLSKEGNGDLYGHL